MIELCCPTTEDAIFVTLEFLYDVSAISIKRKLSSCITCFGWSRVCVIRLCNSIFNVPKCTAIKSLKLDSIQRQPFFFDRNRRPIPGHHYFRKRVVVFLFSQFMSSQFLYMFVVLVLLVESKQQTWLHYRVFPKSKEMKTEALSTEKEVILVSKPSLQEKSVIACESSSNFKNQRQIESRTPSFDASRANLQYKTMSLNRLCSASDKESGETETMNLSHCPCDSFSWFLLQAWTNNWCSDNLYQNETTSSLHHLQQQACIIIILDCDQLHTNSVSALQISLTNPLTQRPTRQGERTNKFYTRLLDSLFRSFFRKKKDFLRSSRVRFVSCL